jgi:16S rRNA (cytidine1402-2'-O)-methyltransferase
MKLFLIPTPIGNLGDITLRALETLREVDAILCEDTRTSGFLLKHYQIQKPLIAYHQHNEHRITEQLVQQMQGGKTFALITDAGTPGVSDPGFLLLRACVKEGVPVECLPGATAFVPALIQSAIPGTSFVFEGFLPHKKGRKTRLEMLAQEERTIVLYESPHRLAKTLSEMQSLFGPDRQAAVSRELTKKFEETRRGTLASLAAHYEEQPPKGEIVLVVEGRPPLKKKGKYDQDREEEDED